MEGIDERAAAIALRRWRRRYWFMVAMAKLRGTLNDVTARLNATREMMTALPEPKLLWWDEAAGVYRRARPGKRAVR